jgi:peptidoglycan/xylan/chitin deacetylase (PgdA/CDA1 family)
MRRGSLRRLSSGAFDRIAGSAFAEQAWGISNRHFLRILAYHGVDDHERFDAQIAHLRTHYVPVSVDEVLDSLEGRPLPQRPVWVTFDDGHPSVVERGLPIIERWEIPVTMFVCPAVIDTTTPLWWQAVELALASGEQVTWNGTAYSGRADATLLVNGLKVAADGERRRVVNAIVEDAHDSKSRRQPQLTSSHVQRLRAAGATIGNHTWDHPCLDTCESDEQRRQIYLAHNSLDSMKSLSRPVLAYPNGNWTRVAQDAAVELGYRIGLLFNHRLTNRADPPMSWSRLRVNSDDSLSRFRSILSGIHPALNRIRGSRALALRKG